MTENSIQAWSSLAMAVIAFIALIVACYEYFSHKEINKHQLFSQLNIRYQESDDIQTVIRYLRIKNPSDKKPTLYQLELFLRFFEEIGMYMSTKSLPAETVDKFFGFYLKELYTSPRGNELLALLIKDEELPYLEIVKKQIGISNNDTKWSCLKALKKVKSCFNEFSFN